jgi:hypothetical protein
MSDPTSEEWTPDTATVRATYATVATYRQSPAPDRVAAFTRWLESERFAARAEAWDEGWEACHAFMGRGIFPPCTNPHREPVDRAEGDGRADCGCADCHTGIFPIMHVCADCGSKRCPRAIHHANPCDRSAGQ